MWLRISFGQKKKTFDFYFLLFSLCWLQTRHGPLGGALQRGLFEGKKKQNKKQECGSMEIDLGEPAVGRDEKENVTLLNRQTTNNCNVLLRLIGKLTIRRRSLESALGSARTRQHQQWKNSKTNRHKGGKLKSVGILHSPSPSLDCADSWPESCVTIKILAVPYWELTSTNKLSTNLHVNLHELNRKDDISPKKIMNSINLWST